MYVSTVVAALSVVFMLAGNAGAEMTGEQAQAYERVRSRAFELLSGSTAEVGGPRNRKAVASLNARAAAVMAEPADLLDFAGPDDPTKEDRLRLYFRRVSLFARAYATVGGRLEGDPAVLKAINAELRHGLPFIAPGQVRPGNWHSYVIVIPRSLGTIVTLVGDKIAPELRGQLLTAMADLMGEMRLTGANAAAEVPNHILYALQVGDAGIDRIGRAVEHMLQAITCGTTEGLLEDYAYQFHGRILYAGGYGVGYLNATAFTAYLVDGTMWEIPAERRRLLARMALEHMQWVVSGPWWDVSVKGRGYRHNGAPSGLFSAMLYLSRMGGPAREELGEAAARMAADYTILPIETAGMADEASRKPAEPLRGFRYWHTGDFAAFKGEGFHASVRMYSRRSQDYECLTKKGMEGWNLSNGFVYLTRGRGEWWTDDVAAPIRGLDWDHLPGTTSRVGANPINRPVSIHDSCHSLNFGRSDFAGAAGDGTGGMAGFVLIPTHGDFIARKSYLFFDDGFACVGAGITSEGASDKPVHTTVAQWAAEQVESALHLSGGRVVEGFKGVKAFEDVRWAWLDGIGYVFPEPVTLYAQRNWRLTTLWLDHGTSPQDASYAYVVYPDLSAAETETMQAERRVQIVCNSASRQAIRDTRTEAMGAVFYKAGRVGQTTVDRPAVVHYRKRPDGGVLTVENPLHTRESIRVTLDGADKVAAAPPEVTVQAAEGKTILTVDTALGRQYRIGFGQAGDVTQQARENMLAYHEDFRVTAASDPVATFLTVTIPAPAWEAGYKLMIRGHKGHDLLQLRAANIVGHPSDRTVRYRWVRKLDPNWADDSLFNQRAGNFRLALISGPAVAIDYFTVPPFDNAGNQLPTAGLEEDKTRPPYE